MNAENLASVKKWGLRTAGSLLGAAGVVGAGVTIHDAIEGDYFDATMAGFGAVTLELGAVACIISPLANARRSSEIASVQEALVIRNDLLGQLEQVLDERHEITRQVIDNLPR